MNVLVAIGGIMGVYSIAAALFGMEYVYPRWKRWLLGTAGAALVLTFVMVYVPPPHRVNDGEPDCDQSVPSRYRDC
jgi:hypothetical protein